MTHTPPFRYIGSIDSPSIIFGYNLVKLFLVFMFGCNSSVICSFWRVWGGFRYWLGS